MELDTIKREEKTVAMLVETLRLARLVERCRKTPLSDTEIEKLAWTISDLFVGRTAIIKKVEE